MMRPWSIVMVSVALAGCGGSSACPPTTPVASTSSDPAVARIIEHERLTCECKALACAVAAQGEMKAWFEGHPTEVAAAMTDPVREMQIDHHGGRAQACRTALYDGATEAERLTADPVRSEFAEVLRMVGAVADQLCACKDLACAEAAMKPLSGMKDPGGKPTDAEMAQAQKLAERMMGCQQKLVASEPTRP